jgi:hypothetical protein
MPKLLHDLFMGPMNANWDLARILGCLVVFVYCGVLIGAFLRGADMDFVAIGTGFAALLAGVAAFIWAKDNARTAALRQDSAPAGDAP